MQPYERLPGETDWECAPSSPYLNNTASPPSLRQTAFPWAFVFSCLEQLLTLLITNVVGQHVFQASSFQHNTTLVRLLTMYCWRQYSLLCTVKLYYNTYIVNYKCIILIVLFMASHVESEVLVVKSTWTQWTHFQCGSNAPFSSTAPWPQIGGADLPICLHNTNHPSAHWKWWSGWTKPSIKITRPRLEVLSMKTTHKLKIKHKISKGYLNVSKLCCQIRVLQHTGAQECNKLDAELPEQALVHDFRWDAEWQSASEDRVSSLTPASFLHTLWRPLNPRRQNHFL